MVTGHPHRRIGGPISLLAAFAASVVVALGASASAGAGESPTAAAPAAPAQRALNLRTSDPPVERPVRADTDWADLQARAARNGSVRVIVELAPDESADSADSADEHLSSLARARNKLIAEFGGQPLRDLNAIEGSPIVAFSADARDLQRLRHSRFVRHVSVDRVLDAGGTVSRGAENGVQNTNWWDYGRIGADWANTNGYTGYGRGIVVIDSGVDRSHGWLSGNVTTEACFATNTNGSGACPGGVTYKYNTTSAGVAGAAAPCTYHVSCAHGTHVAHTAGGTYGTARRASIVAIQASHSEWDAKANAYLPKYATSDLINALWYVYYKLPFWPAAVNLSIGGGGYTGTCDTLEPTITSYINALKAQNVATVIASGNDNYRDRVSWPGCISSAITVGNTTLDYAGNDAVLGYTEGGSNSSATVDLLAPGTDICSAVPVYLDLEDGSRDGVACHWFGTSMAAPHVAGAFAQLRQAYPNATVDQLLSALQRRGTAVLDSRNNITRTRINVANAIYYG